MPHNDRNRTTYMHRNRKACHGHYGRMHPTKSNDVMQYGSHTPANGLSEACSLGLQRTLSSRPEHQVEKERLTCEISCLSLLPARVVFHVKEVCDLLVKIPY